MKAIRKTKDFNPCNCPVTHSFNKIGGKWKITIFYLISKSYFRSSAMLKVLPTISKQTLLNQLKELTEDQLIERIVFPEMPPRVEYHLTEYGLTIIPAIKGLQEWGLKDMARTVIEK
ncbi:winged helix-turn-helix transcriptional regulator [Rhizosphaericola mali]|uniref:Helix-turn-helix transcriptional regulator n=1 Tax=Rhizosphaericola mali TaxID=2545455 RepID=A0A5P2FWN8_9BACT|nr:helix-turn-helix domain-containing protein [Rhizosphaericola mali]QES87936.1 helix-turn-helix transcriptional regulator [Rhizosphaericola mali]